jgi:hypothetical protein
LTLLNTTGTSGNGEVSNPTNAIDGDPTTFASLTVTGNGSANEAVLTLGAPAGMSRSYSSVILCVDRSIPTNSLTGGGSFQPGEQAIYSYAYGNSGTVTFDAQNIGAGTVARSTIQISLPPNINLAGVVIQLSVQSGTLTHATSGSMVLNVYEAYLQCVE